MANCIANLGNAYVQIGEYDKALPLFHEAINIRKALADSSIDYAWHLKSIADLFNTLGNKDSALYYLDEALKVAKFSRGEAHPDYATLLNSKGAVYSNAGDFNSAAPVLIKASEIELDHLFRTYSSLSEEEKFNLLNTEESQFDLLPSLLYTSGIQDVHFNEQVFENELALKGMILQDQKEVLNSIRQQKDETIMQLYKKWVNNKSEIGQRTLHGMMKESASMDSLIDATTQLEQQLSRLSSSFRNELTSQHLKSKDISSRLKTGEAAIEFIKFNIYRKGWTDTVMYAGLLILSGDSFPRFIPLCPEKQLSSLLDNASRSASNETVVELLYGTKYEHRKVNDSLYNLIWKPLEPYLEGIHTIHYAPVALLHRIAFNALHAEGQDHLISKYKLQSLLTSRSLVQANNHSGKPRSASIWGDINYAFETSTSTVNVSRGTEDIGNGQDSRGGTNYKNIYPVTRNYRNSEWIPLNGTKKEIDMLRYLMIQQKVSYKILSGSNATEEAFKSMDGNSPELLHIATHGFFLPPSSPKADKSNDAVFGELFRMQKNSMFRSGLVLAGGNNGWKGIKPSKGKDDGILTAYEIAQMDLSNTRYAVFSACETALGDLEGNEGVIGLQRALKMAGVKQMMATLWKVSDYPTMELISHFYKNWMNGQTTREALRNAQLMIKDKYTNPYYWAGFVIIE